MWCCCVGFLGHVGSTRPAAAATLFCLATPPQESLPGFSACSCFLHSFCCCFTGQLCCLANEQSCSHEDHCKHTRPQTSPSPPSSLSGTPWSTHCCNPFSAPSFSSHPFSFAWEMPWGQPWTLLPLAVWPWEQPWTLPPLAF